MSNPTTQQMNREIAIFMDLIPVRCGTKRLGDIKHPEISEAFLWYHKDWGQFMPVWYKFRDLRFSKQIDQFHHSDLKWIICNSIGYEDIQNTYIKLFNAIQWYNQTKQNDEK